MKRGERGVGLGKFFKREPGDFCHDVINARLEACGGFARNVVLEFVEQVADGQLGGENHQLDNANQSKYPARNQ